MRLISRCSSNTLALDFFDVAVKVDVSQSARMLRVTLNNRQSWHSVHQFEHLRLYVAFSFGAFLFLSAESA